MNSQLPALRTFTILVVLTVLAGCDGVAEPDASPDSIVDRYLELEWSAKRAEAWKLLVPEDQQAQSVDEFVAEDSSSPEIRAMMRPHVSWQTTVTSSADDVAEIQVEITRPAVEQLLGEIMAAAFAGLGSGEKGMEAAIAERVSERLSGPDALPKVTETETYRARKVEGAWRVDAGIAEKVALQERKRAAEAKVAAGDEAFEADKYAEAAALYAEAEALSDDVDVPASRREHLAEELAAIEALETYRDQIEIYEVESAYYERYDGSVPGVWFKVRNNTDRTITRLQVTAFFEDAEGQVISEKTFTLVNDSEYAMGNREPLKPGQIWSMSKNQFYAAERVPSEWEEGSVAIGVSSLRLMNQ